MSKYTIEQFYEFNNFSFFLEEPVKNQLRNYHYSETFKARKARGRFLCLHWLAAFASLRNAHSIIFRCSASEKRLKDKEGVALSYATPTKYNHLNYLLPYLTYHKNLVCFVAPYLLSMK